MDIIELKRLNPIEDVVNQFDEFKLKGTRGRYVTALAHDSFVVDTEKQMYNWNAQGRHGDVLNFLQNEAGMDWPSALSWLAKRAGVELNMSAEQRERYVAVRKREDALDLIVQFFVNRLWADGDTNTDEGGSGGLAYARERGWDDERIASSRLGFWDGDYKGLRAWLVMHNVDLNDPVVVSVLGFNGDVVQWFRLKRPDDSPRADWVAGPKGLGGDQGRITGIVPAPMLIYPHVEGGRVQYLSGRKLVDDEYGKSWNLNQSLVGAKRPFWNDLVRGAKGPILVVEGQADAISAGAWEVPAVALCGGAADDDLVEMLGKFDDVYVCLDGDGAGVRNAKKLAMVLGDGCRIVSIPVREGITDVDDLFRAGMTRAQFKRLMTEGDVYAVWLCRQVDEADVLDRERLAGEAVAEYAKIDKKIRPNYRADAYEALGWTAKRFDATVRALDAEAKEAEKNQAKTNKRIQYSVGGREGDIYYEIIVPDDGGATKFVVSRPGVELGTSVVTTEEFLEFDHYEIHPYPAWHDIVNDPYFYFCSGILPYSNANDLLAVIRSFIYDFMDLPEDVEEYTAIYALLTWFSDRLPVIPYLRAIGDYGGGKTRFIQTAGALSFRPVFCAGPSTEAYLRGVTKMFGFATLVIDELDIVRGDETHPMIAFINVGNRQSGGFAIGRMVKNDEGEHLPTGMASYGAKIMSMRQPFKDAATNSRCWDWKTGSISLRTNIPRVLPLEHEEVEGGVRFWSRAREVRNMCLNFRMNSIHRPLAFNTMEIDSRLNGRFAEMVEAAATIFPEMIEQLNDMAYRKLEQTTLEHNQSSEAKVLYAIIRQYYRPVLNVNNLDDLEKRADKRQEQIELRLSFQPIANEVNRIIRIENEVRSEDADQNKKQFNFSSRRIGSVVSDILTLSKQPRAYKTKRVTEVVFDLQRIKGLADRFGLAETLLAIQNGEPDYFDPPATNNWVNLVAERHPDLIVPERV